MKGALASIACVLLLLGCATQPHQYSADAPGFFIGLWHGYIAFLAVIIGFFTDVRVYNFPNSGYWYDVGFTIGLICSLGTASKAA